MRAIRQFATALISLPLAAGPALALEIASALEMDRLSGFSELEEPVLEVGRTGSSYFGFEQPVLEFDDDDWARFVGIDSTDFFADEDDAANDDPGGAENLFSGTWEAS